MQHDLNPKKSAAREIPSALEDRSLKVRLAESKIVVFLDYDGTLTPIVDNPSRAALSQQTRKVIENLAALCPVIVLSGRDVEDVRKLVGLENVIYVGSHGFDAIDRNGARLSNINWDKFLPALDLAEDILEHELKDLPGVIVERKRYAIAVHYRKVSKSNLAILKLRFNRIGTQFPSLKKTSGKKVFELLPNVDWNKGTALVSLFDILGFTSKDLVVFIGDDLTDEDAFCAIKDQGVGILVGKPKRRTCAGYSLHNYVQVRAFLEQLVQLSGAMNSQTPQF